MLLKFQAEGPEAGGYEANPRPKFWPRVQRPKPEVTIPRLRPKFWPRGFNISGSKCSVQHWHSTPKAVSQQTSS